MTSRIELLRKIKSIEQAIETRSRCLMQLETRDDPESLLEIVKIRGELELLNNEKSKLVEQAEALKKSLEERLPALEKEYLNAVEEERAELKKLYLTCKALESQIQKVRKIANDTHMRFISYKNVCDELGIVAKNLHLPELPFIPQLSRWIASFMEWCEKTGWKQ
jgi:chromosome segregation ATPase